MKPKIRTYNELIRLNSFEERFEYLQLLGQVGEDTFGFDRVFNQMFYKSKEWRQLRNQIIVRDEGRDLAMPGFEIKGEPIFIHHMNPIDIDDIKDATEFLMNPAFLICTRGSTHNAIHYGRFEDLKERLMPNERQPFDTCPWKGGINGK